MRVEDTLKSTCIHFVKKRLHPFLSINLRFKMLFYPMYLNIIRRINPSNRALVTFFLFLLPFYLYFFFQYIFSFYYPSVIFFFQKNKYPCRFVRYLFDDANNANTCTEKCLRIKKALRFGNAMIQLLNVIKIAKLTGMKNVFFPKNFLILKSSFSIKDINFIVINSTKKNDKTGSLNCYSRIFYERSKKISKLPFFIDPEFVNYFHKFLYKIRIPNDSLVIHIRAGDVFKRHFNINFKYGQPPCNYYLDVFRMRNWSQIFLIAEDSSNPCVKILSRVISKPFKPHNLTTDLSILINAPNLVLSRGSFGYAIVLLSKKLQNLYTFNQSSTKIPDHFNCVPTDDYYNSVIKYWEKSRIQKKKLINSNCMRWEYVPKGPKNTNSYIHDVNL